MDELDSRVSVSDLEAGMRAGKPVNLAKYSVIMSSSPLGRKVVWRPVREEDMRFRCEALIMPGDLADVQWLVSPYECRFGLSVRGDLKAVESNEAGAKLWKPRNPVGRLEIRGFQMSTLDTHASIVIKFEQAQEIETCAESHAMRRIAELRALPARQPRLVEIARLLESMQGSAKWPQPLPSQMPSIIGLNTLLKASKLKDLTPEERLALRGNKNDSQWKTWKQTKSSRLDTEEDATEKAERIADLSKLSERFRELTAKMAEGGGLATVMSSRLVHSSCDCLSAQVSFIEETYVSPLEKMQEEFLKEYE